MLIPIQTTRFKRDIKLIKKRGKDLEDLFEVMDLLINEKPLSIRHDDHPLKGNHSGRRECKIEPDWLLIYEKNKTHIAFIATGTHSDLKF